MKKPEVADRPFSSFQVGERVSFEKEITPEDVVRFADLSGDRNPLHTDDAYAAQTRFGRRVAYGLLTVCPISTMAGHLLPGKRCLLLEVRSQFLQPVFAGDRLKYTGTIVQIVEAVQVLKVQVEVTNQEGAVVLKGFYNGQVLPDRNQEENA